jgi:hypothetical protein
MEMPADPRPVVRHEPLVVAIMNEHQLLGELRRALAQQRTGVSSGDPATLEAASHAVSRAILTLDEARRRREQLVELAGEGRPVRLEHIESVAGPVPGLAESRQALRAEAQAAMTNTCCNPKASSVRKGSFSSTGATLPTASVFSILIFLCIYCRR